MKSKQLFFFATKRDLFELVNFLDSSFNIKYAEAGLLNNKVNCISSLHSAIELHLMEYGDWNFNKRYIVLPRDVDLQIREIQQRAGGVKYAVDQMKNNDSIVIFLGGKYNEEAIIASKIGTISQTEFATNMMKNLSAYFKKYKKVEEFFICSEALKAAEEGLRLSTDIQSIDDLRI
jgi:hypothetical protein